MPGQEGESGSKGRQWGRDPEMAPEGHVSEHMVRHGKGATGGMASQDQESRHTVVPNNAADAPRGESGHGGRHRREEAEGERGGETGNLFFGVHEVLTGHNEDLTNFLCTMFPNQNVPARNSLTFSSTSCNVLSKTQVSTLTRGAGDIPLHAYTNTADSDCVACHVIGCGSYHLI